MKQIPMTVSVHRSEVIKLRHDDVDGRGIGAAAKLILPPRVA